MMADEVRERIRKVQSERHDAVILFRNGMRIRLVHTFMGYGFRYEEGGIELHSSLASRINVYDYDGRRISITPKDLFGWCGRIICAPEDIIGIVAVREDDA